MKRTTGLSALDDLTSWAEARGTTLELIPPTTLDGPWVVRLGLTVGTARHLTAALIACRDALEAEQ